MIKDFNDIEVIIRKVLIEQSQVDAEYVRNALSVYGTTLDVERDRQIFTSIAHDTALIIFELQFDSTSTDNVTEQATRGSIRANQAFNVKVIVYGDECKCVSNRLVARLRTEAVRMQLHDKALHLVAVDTPTCIFEFQNDAMWCRCDFNISLACEILIDEISSPDEGDTLNGLTIQII